MPKFWSPPQATGVAIVQIDRCRNCDSECDPRNEVCELCGEPVHSTSIGINGLWGPFASSDAERPRKFTRSSRFRCRACNSECDESTINCEICGEPSMSEFVRHRSRRCFKPRSSAYYNQLCHDCGADFSSLEYSCPICGTETQFLCSTIPEESPVFVPAIRTESGFVGDISDLCNSGLDVIEINLGQKPTPTELGIAMPAAMPARSDKALGAFDADCSGVKFFSDSTRPCPINYMLTV
jgi:hypothetical protein